MAGNDPQIVGNSFVGQYYYILHHYPEEAYKFYQDASVISRPGPDGVTTSITTMKAINDKILSLNYKNYKAEIYSADSQLCVLNGGVIVLVNGCLTGEDNVSRKFTQVFFLVPQDRSSSYYVLNDLFSYVDEKESVVKATNERVVRSAPLTTPDPEPTHASKSNQPLEKNTNDSKENTVVPLTKTASSPKIQEDSTKKSYASIVHALKENNAPFMVRIPPPKPMEQPSATTKAASAPSNNNANNNAKGRKNDPIVKDNSIFVANLPVDATAEQLTEIFKQFGAIKTNSVKVRNYKIDGNCFGFVEFEHASSVQGALEASPIMIGNCKTRIARKRSNNDNGRVPPSRKRNESEKQTEGQARDNSGSNGKGKARSASQSQGQERRK